MSDQVTGLVLVVHEDSGARECDPEIGRWVERDPIGFAGGLNTYVYVEGGPIDAVDRSGLLSDFDLTHGVQGASREQLRQAFVETAPAVAVVGLVGGAAVAAVVLAPPPAKAAVIGAFTRAAQTAYVGAQTAAAEVTAAEVGVGAGVGAGCVKRRLSPAESAGLRDLFDRSSEGAASLRNRLRAGIFVPLPGGVTESSLLTYREIAARTIAEKSDKLGVQAARIEAIDLLLKQMKP
jgi:RHS repeat-associated protein